MGHEIRYHTYDTKTDKAKIEGELNAYVEKATWREGGHGLIHPIRFLDKILPDYESAVEYIKEIERRDYDQVAVKYRRMPHGKTSKKLEDIKAKLIAARKEYYDLDKVVAAQSFKADFVGCKHCGSKISRTYIKSNNCPVCHGDMRSDTTLKKLAALKAKIEKLSADLTTEEQAIALKYGEVCWLVKIEYHM